MSRKHRPRSAQSPEDDPRVKARAVVCLANSAGVDSEELKMRGFMAIFHPEKPEQLVRDLVEDARKNRRRMW